MFLSFNFQINLLNDVSVEYLKWLNDLSWFANLSLKVVDVMPTYVSISPTDGVTVAV